MSENTTVQAADNPGEVDTTAGTDAPNPPEQQSGWSMAKGFIFRMVMMYMVMSFFRQPSQPANTTTTDQSGKTVTYQPSFNIYPEGTKFEMHLFTCELENCTFDDQKLLYAQGGLIYGDWNGGENDDSTYIFSSKVTTSANLLNNGSIFLHVYVIESNKGDLKSNLDSNRLIHKVHQLNKYKKRKFVSTSNLLTGKTDVQPDLVKKENSTEMEILSHWHPNITINYVMDQTPWTIGSLPKPLDEYIEFMEDGTAYKPVVFFNNYWNLQTDYKPINETTPELNLTVTIYPLSMLKWQFYSAQGMRNQWYSQFMGDGGADQSDEEQDVLKTTIMETNPYLLLLTMCVSLVHSVFEFLAFKNDIQFWKDRKTLEGLSVRSVFFSVFQSLIVLLYILDNETNFVVIISVFIGLLIDIWKITKVVNVKLDYEDKWFDSIPKLKMADKSTYVESKTKQYDQMAFKYLSWALFPLLASYGVYSLIYHEHKGWYSWVLSMLYGFLLMFGFIMMTPQLFINYKLKSVAHLPWRMMTYKALNTFIDDLFAFVIKMPTLYRLGCFRDDLVFIIFLYQRYIYKVDPTRVNEFGTSGEMAQGEPAQNALDSNAESEPLIDKPEVEKKTD